MVDEPARGFPPCIPFLHPVFPATVARMERQRNPAAPLAARRRTTCPGPGGGHCFTSIACLGELTEQRALNTEGEIRFEEESVVVTSADCHLRRPACSAGRRACASAGATDDMDQRPCPVRDRIDRC